MDVKQHSISNSTITVACSCGRELTQGDDDGGVESSPAVVTVGAQRDHHHVGDAADRLLQHRPAVPARTTATVRLQVRGPQRHHHVP